jgi:hypothetical protein
VSAPSICFGVIAESSSYNWFTSAQCGLAGVGDHQDAAEFVLGGLADHGGAVPTIVHVAELLSPDGSAAPSHDPTRKRRTSTLGIGASVSA